MASPRRWTREELLLTYELYCQTPFGRLHRQNQDVIALATLLERTPSAVAMKLVNFASHDEAQQARGIKGLSNSSRADREIVEEFKSNWDELVFEASQVRSRLGGVNENVETDNDNPSEIWNPAVPTERVGGQRKSRVAQGFFRKAVFASYEGTCAICEIRHPGLLNASHIVPWAESESRRADPTNGLCLCAIHDRAFDRGFLGVDSRYRIVLSDTLANENLSGDMFTPVFGRFEGQSLRLPQKFQPCIKALRFHYDNVFQGVGIQQQ